MRRFLVILLGASLLVAPCLADDSHWAGYGSLGLGFVPDYDGARNYVLLPYVEARVNYDNYYVRFEGAALRFNVVDDETFHAGPLMGFRRGRHGIDSPLVSQLPKFDDTETAGVFVEWEHVADDPRSGESVTLSVDDAVTDNSSGWAAVLRADIRRPVEAINPGFIVTVEGDVSWSSRAYMQTYFGVTPDGEAASGLPVFNASSGVSQLGVALCVDQFLSRHWSVGVRTHYGRLTASAARSPLTAIAGSPDQYFLGAVIGYVL